MHAQLPAAALQTPFIEQSASVAHAAAAATVLVAATPSKRRRIGAITQRVFFYV